MKANVLFLLGLGITSICSAFAAIFIPIGLLDANHPLSIMVETNTLIGYSIGFSIIFALISGMMLVAIAIGLHIEGSIEAN